MTDRQIISLLKRYMDGATTVEEETALADFFCTATDADRPDAISAADWSAYREMFSPLAQQAACLVPADSIADSISAEQPQRILADSVKQQPEKQRLHKSLRPYWQPRPPKVYVAEADRSASTHADSTDIEEAVRQADILLHAINANQSAAINQLELQAMELFEADDAEADEYESEVTGNSIQQ